MGLAKLAKSVLMSQRKVQDTITYLEKRGLIKRVGSILGGASKGNVYQVPLPATATAPCTTVAGGAETARDATAAPRATSAPDATVARRATNKDDDDDIKKRKSSSKGSELAGQIEAVENHSHAAAPQERQEGAAHDFAVVRAAYEKATGNRWTSSDSEAYDKSEIGSVPVSRVLSILESVPLRTPGKINSFKYFVKEIVSTQDPCNRAWQKKQLEKIVQRIRDNAVGRAGYSAGDLVEDVELACAREAVLFDDDLFNQVMR